MKPPLAWPDALEAEYRALYGDPGLDPSTGSDADGRLRAIYARLHQRGPTALCLSGGGIRSATFALGVLQGLANVGVLGTLDYLSTVSGGGYIGGWLTAWLKREGRAGRAGVLATLDPPRASHGSLCGHVPDETSPVERVRNTCRYLAPRGGLVSADVWALIATLTRNLVLNWFVILPLLAAALMVPRLYYGGVQIVEKGFVSGPCSVPGDAASVSFLVALLAFVVSSGYVVLNLVGFGGNWSQQRFLAWFLAPALAGAIALTFFWSAYPCDISLRRSLLLSALVPAAGWILLGAAARISRRRRARDGSVLRVKVGMKTVAAALAAGPILGAGAWWFSSFEYGFGAGDAMRELYAIFAVPIVLALVLIQMTVFIGLASSELDDAVLEWWSRAAAWISIAGVLWISAGLVVFYMASLIEGWAGAMERVLSMDRKTTSAAVAAVVPLVSSLAGFLSPRDDRPGRPSTIRLLLNRLLLPGIIFVLLSAIAWGNLRLIESMEYHWFNATTRCAPGAGFPCHATGGGLGENVILGAGFAAFGLLMSWFVPVNRFSLHGMYQQRLIRTFLGASRRDRRPNRFTGFDANDDLCVHHLAGVRPMHVINATLNAVSSTHVGRNEIKAQSFTFCPLHVGGQDVGYRPASEYGSDGGGRGTGVSLGMAMAISGAAASPAMGMFTTKARAFLLTLANARLGVWFGNPRDDSAWQTSDPPLGVGPLLRELLGLTTDRNPYVYLSDGGHYENLGLWEMVARRCRFIIVSDAGCDPNYSFDDLANAVRRIRLDLGIPIQFPPIDLTRAGQGQTNPHGAIGRIAYSAVDGPDAPDGTILYLKATLSGDEPVDVLNFAHLDPTFPHDTTGNQFFDEARFESYRALGFHTVMSVAGGLRNLRDAEALCQAAHQTFNAAAPGREPASVAVTT